MRAARSIRRLGSASQTAALKQTSAASWARPQSVSLRAAASNQSVQQFLSSQLFQAKLAINQPGDQFEQEADRVSDQVMRMTEFGTGDPPQIQRMCAHCQNELEAPHVQRLCSECEEQMHRQPNDRSRGTPQVPPKLQTQIAALRGGGQPLDASIRRFFERRFGRDFSDVRIHEQSAAADTARAVNALAYTTGRDIVFASSQYSPETNPGRRLIAHELTHVVQQRSGRMTGQNSAIQRACPKAPTHLGDNAPDPDQDCEEAHTSVGGQMFFFCVDSDVLTDESEARLNALAPALQQLPVVEIHGYASPDGPAGREDIYNLNLSCFRARRAASILTGKGVLSTRMQIFKHGGTLEFGKNDKNRVVVIPNIVPVSPGPLRNKFRVAALSFLACAPCNPFTDDGAVTTSPLSPPTSEPASGSSFRMKHWIEVEAISDDSIHIKSSSILNSGQEPGKSGYCGKVDPATAVSKSGPVGPKAGSDPVHGESVEWESELVTRVNANVPATLPDAPCGPLGTNPMIPPISNRFRMRIFADGTRESEFLSASTFPFQHLYEDGSVKMFAGKPVHPAIDFDAWATSTGVSATEAEVGFKALREACCKGLTLPGCATVCKGNKSEVVSGFGVKTGDLTLACLGVGALLFASPCPSPCGPAGTACPIPTLPSNP